MRLRLISIVSDVSTHNWGERLASGAGRHVFAKTRIAGPVRASNHGATKWIKRTQEVTAVAARLRARTPRRLSFPAERSQEPEHLSALVGSLDGPPDLGRNHIGDAIRAVREARGMSQEELAQANAYDRFYLNGLESGRGTFLRHAAAAHPEVARHHPQRHV